MSAPAKMAPNPINPALTKLLADAAAKSKLPGAYSGEVLPQDVYDYVTTQPNALLVDVRTQPEWTYAGYPDIKNKVATISWKIYPTMSLNAQFADQLAATGAKEDTVIFFMCRGGGRSLDAAIAMTAQGYQHCFNVIGGFEGEKDAAGHRNTVSGWRAAKLPWIES